MEHDAHLCGFNPRTRVGCDPQVQPQEPSGHVSIHAPAWGATDCPGHSGACRAGFNPRTRVGCDLSLADVLHPQTVFQSTHPRGVRHLGLRLQQTVHPVSIHAPAWGATVLLPGQAGFPDGFQSTHPRGVRPIQQRLGHPVAAGFNPRTRVGCDASWISAWTGPSSFNPRTRVGCDTAASQQSQITNQFQSTHPRGVRPCGDGWETVMGYVSIHAPAWGATHRLCGCYVWLSSFNPRTRVGCDHRPDVVGQGLRVSIHAPAWGATSVRTT